MMKDESQDRRDFFPKVEIPQKRKKWYHEHLGLNTDQYGGHLRMETAT